jgi:hypothetical protein
MANDLARSVASAVGRATSGYAGDLGYSMIGTGGSLGPTDGPRPAAAPSNGGKTSSAKTGRPAVPKGKSKAAPTKAKAAAKGSPRSGGKAKSRGRVGAKAARPGRVKAGKGRRRKLAGAR